MKGAIDEDVAEGMWLTLARRLKLASLVMGMAVLCGLRGERYVDARGFTERQASCLVRDFSLSNRANALTL